MKENIKPTIDKKKSLIASILLFIFMLSLSSVAFASSYTSTLKFKEECFGDVRTFNGSNIMYSTKTKSSKANDKGTYTVTLERESGIFCLYVGSKTLNRVGTGTAKWSNVGSGSYRLVFTKTNDGITVSSDNVIIKNYTEK